VHDHSWVGNSPVAFSSQHSALSRRTMVEVMKDFRDLTVWQKGHDLALASYRRTAVSQTGNLRSHQPDPPLLCSIAANIAEGCGKRSNSEFQRSLQIATGSSSELEYHFLSGKDLGFLANEEYRQLEAEVTEVKKMVAGPIRKIESDRGVAEH
jgi:hypothetical protein